MEKTPTEINKPKISKKRHIAKTITWRIVGSIDTWIIGYVLIRNEKIISNIITYFVYRKYSFANFCTKAS